MADLKISVDIDASGTKKGAAEAKAAIDGITNSAEKTRKSVAGIDFERISTQLKSVGAQMQQFGGQLRNIGTTLSLAVTVPIVAIGKSILQAGADYEKALNIFQAVTKATSSEMDRAAQVAKDLGADLSLPATSAKDAALAMNELGKAGLTASQSIDAAKGVLQLAAAGQIDEARAAEIAANALNAFKLEAADTTRVANLLAAASNASSSEVDDIALSLQQASAVFASAKVPIEDVVTAIGELANAGIKGQDAGTSLKQFLLSIEAPTKTAAATMKQLGVDVFDTAGRLKSLPEIIGSFETALSGLTDQQKAGALQKIFGSDAIRAAQILFNTGEEGFKKMKEAVTANGAAADLANAKMKGLSGAWEGFKSQLETVGITLYEVIKTPLTEFLQNAATVAGNFGDAFSTLSPTIQQAVIVFAALLAALGPALVIIGSIISAVGTLASAFGAVAAAIGAAGGIGTVAAVIAGIGVAIAPVVVWVGVLYTAWQTNFGGIRELTATVVAAIGEAWNSLMGALSELTQAVLAEVTAFWQKNGDDIIAIVKEFSDAFRSVWTAIVEFWRENNGTIKEIASLVWDAIRTIIVGVVRIIGDVITLFLKTVNGDWAGAWEATKKLLSDVTQAWLRIVTDIGIVLIEAVRAVFYGLNSLAKFIFDQGVQLGVNLVDGLVSGIKAKVGDVAAVGRLVGNAAVQAIKDQLKIQSPSKVMHEVGQFVVEGLADGMTENAGKAAAAATGIGGKLIETFKGFIGGDLKGFLNSAFETLTDSSRSWGDRIKSIFGGIVQNFRRMASDMLSTWLNNFLKPILGGGGIGPGGTPNFNPGAGGITFGGGSSVPATGTIVDGAYTVNGNQSPGGFGGFGGLAGGITIAGGLATVLGGAIGGRAGGFISNIGSGVALGAQIGSIIPGIGTLIGAGIGAAVGFFASLFGGDPKQKRDKKEKLPALTAGFTDALQQLRQLIEDVRTLRVSPDSALAKATELRGQIASGFGIQFESKKYSRQAQQQIAAKLVEADALIAQLRDAADVARAAGERDRRILPEFANGVYLSPAFQSFRRQNGMLGGVYTGRDTIPSMLAPGEMVLNPSQMGRVIGAAGFDVFKTAGIPGYAGGGVVQPATVQNGPVNLTINLSQDAAGMWTATAESDAGQKVIAKVVSNAFRDDAIKTKRR